MKVVDTNACRYLLQKIDKIKSDRSHIHVVDAIPNLPAGAITSAIWNDNIVTDNNGNIWLACNGQIVDPNDYPELLNLGNIKENRVTPHLTSANSHPPISVTANSYSNENGAPWNVLNGKNPSTDTDQWRCSNVPLPHWIMINLGVPTSIVKYRMYVRGYNDGNTLACFPSDWILQASNDNVNFDIIDEVVGAYPTVIGEMLEYPLDEKVTYQYYRWNITKRREGPGWLNYQGSLIGEIELFDENIVLPILENQYIKVTDNKIFNGYPIGWQKVLGCGDETIDACDGEWLRMDGREIDIETYPLLIDTTSIEKINDEWYLKNIPLVNGQWTYVKATTYILP